MDTIRNVVIIGGGPAGLSAAIYNARAGLKPTLFAGSPPGGQLMLTTEVENFPGYKAIMGPELIDVLRKQAQTFETEIIDANVTSIDFSQQPFTLTYSKKQIKTHALIIATGAKALWLGLESEERLRGKGVSACATCDGFFFRNKNVAVVGGGDTAMEEAQTLTRFANKVYLIHRKEEFRASKIMQQRVKENPKIELILNNQITEFIGENKVEAINLLNTYKDTKTLKLDGVFIAIGHKPDTAMFKDFLDLDDKGYILTAQMKAIEYVKGLSKGKTENNLKVEDYTFNSMTSIDGIFAAGDCVDHTYRQASTAAGMGVAAALDVERWLEERLSK